MEPISSRGPEDREALFDAMESALPEDSPLRLELTLRPLPAPSGRTTFRVSLRIGLDRLYVVKNPGLLFEAMDAGRPMEFGKGFTYHPAWMRFSEPAQLAVDLLRAVQDTREELDPAGEAESRTILLPSPFVPRLLELLTELPYVWEDAAGECVHRDPVRTKSIPLLYRLTGDENGLRLNVRLPRELTPLTPLTPDCAFLTDGSTVLRTEETQRRVLQVLLPRMASGSAGFSFPAEDVGRVFDELLPYLMQTGAVELDSRLEKKLLRLPLTARLYLDWDGTVVTARTIFAYGEREIDPFRSPAENRRLSPDRRLLLRDGKAERRVLDALGAAGFHICAERVYLTGADPVWRFLTDGLQSLQSLCELYMSNAFGRLTPRHPALRGRLGLRGGQLELTLTDGGEPTAEIRGIMEALARGKAYFRLRDGTFLDLRALEAWHDFAAELTEAAHAEESFARASEEDVLRIGAARVCQMERLIAGLPVEADADVRRTAALLGRGAETAAEAESFPEDHMLRPYQRRGFRWLMTLDRLQMGGVLADDMGLGKTVQMIAVLHACRAEQAVSLVVAPTSLSYNWLSELERFAPDLSVMVLTGPAERRAAMISHVQKARDVDVLITSYPLIRRDIGLLEQIDFRFVVLDEAQHIKNAGSVGAQAVKRLHARTRFALTGTPMENGIGELWSVFDFVLPGYLLGYGAFLRRYQDGQEADALRRRIRPFLLRRLKRDVLPELPDKQERTLTARMTPAQEKVYEASLTRLRERVRRVLDEKGLNRGRAEVLDILSELRRICCHPRLELPAYEGSSGKLDLLLDILPSATEAGHRVLLFSQYTTMLRLLRQTLEAQGYSCLYLDGETPPASRLELTERFNSGYGQLFLISLKAGGTGLNLTGADMVIHYDPWWNPAAEDQATDRAYRIGQTRKVEVIRLVTYGSIEEQVVKMGERKKALFDQLITPGEELVTALTEKDIRDLFA